MRILIDATTAREGGGVTYVRNFLPVLARYRGVHDISVLFSSEYQNDLANELPDGLLAITRRVPKDIIRRGIFLQTGLPRLLRKEKFDLLFSVAEIATFRSPCPHVVLVRNPNVFFPMQQGKHWRFMPNASWLRLPLASLVLRHADYRLFVSNAFREEVLVQQKLGSCNSDVLYHGLGLIFRGEDLSVLPENFRKPYFLAVSSLAPHKNFETMLKAFAAFRATGMHPEIRMVIVGSTGNTGYYRSLVSLVKSLGLDGQVLFTGRIPYENLPVIYRNAEAFIFPSLLESFGHPYVEAMACGSPVIASAIPIAREICGDAAIYFSPGNDNELAGRMVEIMDNREHTVDRVAVGHKRALDFSWEITAQRLIGFFETTARFNEGDHEQRKT